MRRAGSQTLSTPSIQHLSLTRPTALAPPATTGSGPKGRSPPTPPIQQRPLPALPQPRPRLPWRAATAAAAPRPPLLARSVGCTIMQLSPINVINHHMTPVRTRIDGRRRRRRGRGRPHHAPHRQAQARAHPCKKEGQRSRTRALVRVVGVHLGRAALRGLPWPLRRLLLQRQWWWCWPAAGIGGAQQQDVVVFLLLGVAWSGWGWGVRRSRHLQIGPGAVGRRRWHRSLVSCFGLGLVGCQDWWESVRQGCRKDTTSTLANGNHRLSRFGEEEMRARGHDAAACPSPYPVESMPHTRIGRNRARGLNRDYIVQNDRLGRPESQERSVVSRSTSGVTYHSRKSARGGDTRHVRA